MLDDSSVRVDTGDLFPAGGPPIRITTNFDHGPHDPNHQGRDLTYQSHSHGFSEVVIILGGSGRHHVGRESFPFRRGDVFRIPPDTPHHFDADEKVTLVNLIFLPEVLAPWEGELRTLPGFQAFFNLEPELRQRHQFRSRLSLPPLALGPLSEKLAALREEDVQRREGYRLSLQLKFVDLLVFLSREYDRMTGREAVSLQRIGRAMSLMESRPEQDWTIGDLQQIVPVSRSTLRRLFVETVGRAPIDYLIGLRLEKARTLLEQSDHSVTEIAFAAGFRDSNYFTRQFTARYGVSPLKYRKGGR
jgi:AraC-like DNA-binding protein